MQGCRQKWIPVYMVPAVNSLRCLNPDLIWNVPVENKGDVRSRFYFHVFSVSVIRKTVSWFHVCDFKTDGFGFAFSFR